ncbi:hypothetical protein ACTXT7_003640 [Hymenolepis weldensis]
MCLPAKAHLSSSLRIDFVFAFVVVQHYADNLKTGKTSKKQKLSMKPGHQNSLHSKPDPNVP